MRSKRWSGRTDLSGQALDDANNRAAARAAARTSRIDARSYVCAAAYVDGARELVVAARCRARSSTMRAGAHGFGYDPYFSRDELGQTFGEATREEKERVSHRGRAFRALLERAADAWRIERSDSRLSRQLILVSASDTFEGSRGVA